MANAVKNKAAKGRLNILVMRSKGDVLNLSVSPFILFVAFLFAIAFVAVSVFIINQYSILYLEYGDLRKNHEEVAAQLGRLQDLYAYQSAVDNDYLQTLNALNWGELAAEPESAAGAAEGQNGAAEAAADDPGQTPVEGQRQVSVAGLLEAWAANFSEVSAQPEHSLDVEKLEVAGANFKFILTNEAPGTQVRGNLLLLFAVEADGLVSLVPFPDFDHQSGGVDFSVGPGYNIRSKKTISGRLKIAPDDKILEMMVVAKAASGAIVLKKRIMPQ